MSTRFYFLYVYLLPYNYTNIIEEENMIYEHLGYVKKMPIFKGKMAGKIEVYSARESYEKIRHYEDWEHNDYDINSEIDVHQTEDWVFGKYTSGEMVTIGNEVVCKNSDSNDLETFVSRPTSNNPHIISRFCEDKAYKTDKSDLRTTVQVKFSVIYDKHSNLTKPMTIIKDLYKSDEKTPDYPEKKMTNVITFARSQVSDVILEGIESIITDSTQMISGYLMADAKYAYTTENELMRLGLKFLNATPEFDEYVLPKFKWLTEDTCAVEYIRHSKPSEVLSRETFKVVGDSLRLEEIVAQPTTISFTYNEEYKDYEYHAKTLSGDGDVYEFFGHINIPTSGEYICAKQTKEGKMSMSYMSYFDSVFCTDPTGTYYNVKKAIDKVVVNGETIFEYEYDSRYGICTSLKNKEGKELIMYSEHSEDGIIYKESLTYADVLTPIPDKTKLYYRAIGIDEKTNIIVKDYRAVIVKKTER